MKKFWIKLCTITGQLVWYATFMVASGMLVFLYMRDQKAAAKQETATIEKPVTLNPQSEPELQELEPVSFSQPSNAERLAKVKQKAKSRPAKKPAAQKPVVYVKETPKKATPVAVAEKPTAKATKQRATQAKAVPAAKKKEAVTAKPVATNRISPTSEQIRNMAINSAEWEQTKVVALSSLQSRSAAIESEAAWSMEKKQAAADAIRKEQEKKNAVQKFFGL